MLILILSFSFSTHVFFSYLANPPSPASSPPQLSGSRQEPYIGEGNISRHPPLNLGASSGSGPLVPLGARIIGQAAAPSGGWRRGGGQATRLSRDRILGQGNKISVALGQTNGQNFTHTADTFTQKFPVQLYTPISINDILASKALRY